ncbi:MAG TPA: hypothetical protein VJM31_02325 [Vicinamibacterales bacterium]|nr:hypothetical protein [Vicinamibacterales bacterium]
MIRRSGFGTAVILCLIVLIGILAGAATEARRAQAAAQAPGTSGEAAAILAAAREALGGDKRMSAIKTISSTGRTRQVQGDNLVPIEFEITIELPDKYVRTDEIPARESGPNSRGFNGNGLIQIGDAPGPGGRRGGPPPPGAGVPPPSGAPAREGGGDRGRGPGGPPPNPTLPVKQDFARLTLGMFAMSFSSYPLTFGYAGQAEAPEGKADVIDVKGEGNFAARLFIDSKTHLPLMLSWTTPPNLVPVVRGQAPPANLAPGAVTFETPIPPSASATAEQKKQFEEEALAARAAAMKSARPTEHRLYYADYREVDGLKFPFRLRRAVGATTTEETLFDRFRINGRVDPRKFEVRK